MPHNRKKIRQRVMLRVFGDKFAWGSSIVSLSAVMGAIALHGNPVAITVAGVAAVAGVGKWAWNYAHFDELSREAMEELQTEIEQAHERDLDELDQRCRSDDDPSDEEMLRQLRELNEKFRGDHSWMRDMNPGTIAELESTAADIFDTAVNRIRESLDHRDERDKSRVSQIREGHERARRMLLASVREMVELLADIYTKMIDKSVSRTVKQAEMSAKDIAPFQARFQQILDLDQRVEERMRQMTGSEF